VNATPVKRKLAAILAADAVGYSRMMAADEEGTLKILSAHRAVIDGIIEFHEGRIVGTAGDSVLAEFASAVEAVRCAVEIQDALKTRNDSLPEPRRMQFRIGVNLGDVMAKGDDLLGDGVNVAARLETIAEPGGICVSSSVYDQIAGKLDLGFIDIGAQSLKNIQRPIQVYRVERGGLRAASAPAPAPAPAPRRARWAWIGAGVVLVLLAAGLAWQFVLLPQLRSAQAERAEAEVARLRAEADAAARRAAEAKRAAEQAQTAASAQRAAEEQQRTAEARARQRGDAERTRAEALAVQRKAAAQRAVKTPPTQSASPPGSPPMQTGLAAASPAAAPAPVAVPPPRSYEGAWQGQLACQPFARRPAFRSPIAVTVAGRAFTLQRGEQGGPESLQLAGSAEPSGRLYLTGNGFAGEPTRRAKSGQPYSAEFDGRFEGPRYEAKGRLGAQECTLVMTRGS
jgi:class 3 adenylate cyclase